MRSIETTVTIDSDGTARFDRAIPLAPGRHRAVIVIDESIEPARDPIEPWIDWLDRMFGSLADTDLQRHPQGEYEQREALE